MAIIVGVEKQNYFSSVTGVCILVYILFWLGQRFFRIFMTVVLDETHSRKTDFYSDPRQQGLQGDVVYLS
jgi:hypothetical protein